MNNTGLIVGVTVAVVLIAVAIWQYKKHCR